MVLAILMATMLVSQSGAPRDPARVELEARQWFNNPVYRLHDDRTVFLFFFTLEKNEAGETSRRWAQQLNKYALKKEYVIIGLTTASPFDVEKFIKEARIRFTVGAGSNVVKALKIDRFPKILRIERRTETPAGKTAEPKLEWKFFDVLEETTQVLGSLEADDMPTLSNMGPFDLMDYIEGPNDGWYRATAVRRLFESIPREELLRYAQARLPVEPHPWVRGKLQYCSEVAAGTRKDDDGPSISSRANTEFRQNPEAEQWAPVRAYLAIPAEVRADPGKAFEIYRQNGGFDPVETLIRRMVVYDVWHLCENDPVQCERYRAEVRTMLLEVAMMDNDPSIRMLACMGLAQICATGDIEAAERIEALAAVEPEILRTRPMMEFVANAIRTGVDDSNQMSLEP